MVVIVNVLESIGAATENVFELILTVMENVFESIGIVMLKVESRMLVLVIEKCASIGIATEKIVESCLASVGVRLSLHFASAGTTETLMTVANTARGTIAVRFGPGERFGLFWRIRRRVAPGVPGIMPDSGATLTA